MNEPVARQRGYLASTAAVSATGTPSAGSNERLPPSRVQTSRLPSSWSRRAVVLGSEQVAHREAPVRPPAIRYLGDLGFGRKVVQAVGSLDRASEREVAREEDIGPI